MSSAAFWWGGAMMMGGIVALLLVIWRPAWSAPKFLPVIALFLGATWVLFGGNSVDSGYVAPGGGIGSSPAVKVAHAATKPTGEKGGRIVWLSSHDDGVAKALAAKKPVMIDFTAEWCQACKELDRETYTAPSVRAQAMRFVNLKIDATEVDDTIERLFKRYGVLGLPTVVFIDSTGNVLPSPRVTGFVEAKRFAELMAKVR
jgi:thiol:disulfide interchange protein DsbD